MRILALLTCGFLSMSTSYGFHFTYSHPSVHQDSIRTLFTDQATAQVKIMQVGNSDLTYIKAQKVDYKVQSLILKENTGSKNYLIKTVKTDSSIMGYESTYGNVHVELRPLDNLSHIESALEHHCDEIKIEPYFYKTLTYACCTGSDDIALYDYANRLIIHSNNEVIGATIINSPVHFFFGFKQIDKDPSLFGELCLAYNSEFNYRIKLRSKRIVKANCDPYNSKISLVTPHKQVQTDGEERRYILHMDGVKNRNQINQVTLRLEYTCPVDVEVQNRVNPVTIDIPIRNGKPFGKDEPIQIIDIP